MQFQIEPMNDSHWSGAAAIYKEGIETGIATFETDVPGFLEWDGSHLKTCRLVATSDNRIIGWAALSPVSERCVYSGVAEVSVYVAVSTRNKGVGKALLNRLIEDSEKEGIWTLQAGIFPENVASIELHKSCGFREVGIREKPGRLHGKWRDVLLMERRSEIAGI